MIEESKAKSFSRARDKLIIDLEHLLQKQQVLLQIDRLEYSTPKPTVSFEEFLTILKSYGVFEILKPAINQIKSAMKTPDGLIDYKGFISCLRKAQAVPRFVLPQPRVMTPLELPWKLPPLPPIYGKETAKVDRWSEKEWEDYYFTQNDDNDDEDEEEGRKK
uniref:Uncharacterized protein n=1 Tax=Panagrolaimus sp. ES5 TaxID=591445 RepID=A0AC34G176_9BILA